MSQIQVVDKRCKTAGKKELRIRKWKKKISCIMYKHVDNISTKRESDLEIQLDYKSPRFRNKALSYGQ